jgi:large subunit ribosomal protein L20
MPRAKNSVASRRRRKKILKLAKGYWGARSKVYTVAKHAVEKGLQYQYRDRRVRKRQFRRLWILRINAGARQNDTTYSKLISALHKKNIDINRKVLADLAMNDPGTFTQVVQAAMEA